MKWRSFACIHWHFLALVSNKNWRITKLFELMIFFISEKWEEWNGLHFGVKKGEQYMSTKRKWMALSLDRMVFKFGSRHDHNKISCINVESWDVENLNVRGIVRIVAFDDKSLLCVTTDTDDMCQIPGILNFDYNAIAIISSIPFRKNESYQISAVGFSPYIQPYRFIFLCLIFKLEFIKMKCGSKNGIFFSFN